MEKQIREGTGTQTQDEDVCDLCRITYSIYANFPPVPSAQALNAETGEFFPFDRLRSLSTGYDMAKALGYAWACDCRGRTPVTRRINYNEQFQLLDTHTGKPLVNVEYAVERASGDIEHGVTDASGYTHRLSMTSSAEEINIYCNGAKHA
ncbi:hypothetical protein [Paraburkholderia sp. JPY419]|uniref:hypothetical protein n=1 Tax=Paraburkholderia sp. JPY419 TaxID=667660 RepID=UPI003D1B76BE